MTVRNLARRWGALAAIGVVAAASFARPSNAAGTGRPSMEVSIVADEAEAALAVLDRLRRGQKVTVADWSRLRATEGYRRLERREVGMGRAFDDSTFARFLLADSTRARTAALSRTVAEWKRANLEAAGRRALEYLPPGARIRATVYLVIKPSSNSFVFETQTDPAIFIFVDPDVPQAKLENTVAHELHHIGYASACSSAPDSVQSEAVGTCRNWMSAFGEGLAMLAAAGDPETHPHATSPPSDRDRWDRDVARLEPDLRALEAFFLDVLDGRLTNPDSLRARGMAFFGVQGPWYTVGYRMAVAIERADGRGALLRAMCDPAALLEAYNAAAARTNASGAGASRTGPLPLWRETLLRRVRAPVAP